MYSFLPPNAFRYTLKIGMSGSDVWALQINLNSFGSSLVEDGAFGVNTESAVKVFQGNRGLVKDGIAGPVTQTRMCVDLIAKYQSLYPELPSGLMRGIIEGESGYFVGCVNTSIPGGIDTGWTQERIEQSEYSNDAFHKAFRAADAFPLLANRLDTQAKAFYGEPGAKTAELAWWCATLYWNWPAAAQQYALGNIDTWTYQAQYYPSLNIPDDGVAIAFYPNYEIRRYLMKTSAQWIKKIGVTGVSTGAQWSDFYVKSKWAYVGSTWPTP